MGNSSRSKRERKDTPFFTDASAERERVARCVKEGRDLFPRYKHVPCEAERQLRKDIKPGVPLDLVLDLNACDDDLRPVCLPQAEKRWKEAQENRRAAAQEGGFQRKRTNVAAEIVATHMAYIRSKKAEGANKSEVIRWLKARRKSAGLSCAGRSEMYRHLQRSGLWD